jgi:hypothetical protein
MKSTFIIGAIASIATLAALTTIHRDTILAMKQFQCQTTNYHASNSSLTTFCYPRPIYTTANYQK